jgi:hypothetical protein
LVLNKMGVAVQGFPMEYIEGLANEKIYILRVRIHDIFTTNVEIVAVAQEGKGVLKGPVGDVLKIEAITDDNEEYLPNVLANLQAFVGEHASTDEEQGTMAMSTAILDWMAGQAPTTLTEVMEANFDHSYVCDGDSMHHVMKGNIGVFIGAGYEIGLKNVVISGIKNAGLWGSYKCGTYITSHAAQSLPGYGGATSRGFSLAGSKYVYLNTITIDDVTSDYANAVGIDCIGTNDHILAVNVVVNSGSTSSISTIVGAKSGIFGGSPNQVATGVVMQLSGLESDFKWVGPCPLGTAVEGTCYNIQVR